MEIEVIDKRVNPLLNRTEVKFRIVHDAASTPARKDVREAVAKVMGATKEKVVIDHMSSVFGKAETHGYAKVYKTKIEAMTVENEKIRKKHGLIEPKKKAEGEGEEKPEAEAKDAPVQ
jgi:small subunit ribosomal protein S24e